MLKWMGAALIFLACAGCGFGMARAYLREERMLEQLLRMLQRIENELSCLLTPLPELFYRLSGQNGGELETLMVQLAQKLEGQQEPDAQRCMFAVLEEHKDISERVRELLMELGASLGQFDLQGQIREVQAVQAQCQRLLEERRTGKDDTLRRYRILGVCVGAALSLVLL